MEWFDQLETLASYQNTSPFVWSKGIKIFKSGSVTLTEVLPNIGQPDTVRASVVSTSGNTYHTMLRFAPDYQWKSTLDWGLPREWECDCKWNQYAYERNPGYEHLDSRFCSHALATLVQIRETYRNPKLRTQWEKQEEQEQVGRPPEWGEKVKAKPPSIWQMLRKKQPEPKKNPWEDMSGEEMKNQALPTKPWSDEPYWERQKLDNAVAPSQEETGRPSWYEKGKEKLKEKIKKRLFGMGFSPEDVDYLFKIGALDVMGIEHMDDVTLYNQVSNEHLKHEREGARARNIDDLIKETFDFSKLEPEELNKMLENLFIS